MKFRIFETTTYRTVFIAVAILSFCLTAGAQNDEEADGDNGQWRIDSSTTIVRLPRNFRVFMPTPANPDCPEMNLSASGQYTPTEMRAVVDSLRHLAKGDIWLVDLRQESHFFKDGLAVSWYCDHNWGNRGKDNSACEEDEQKRMLAAHGTSERQMADSLGVKYLRIRATDHLCPEDSLIDVFADFVRSLSADDWVHIHCAAGKGRTGVMLAVYEAIKNPTATLDEILQRQRRMGASDLYSKVQKTKDAENRARQMPRIFKRVRKSKRSE